MDAPEFLSRLRQRLEADLGLGSAAPGAPGAPGEPRTPPSSLHALLVALESQGRETPEIDGEIARGGMGVVLRVHDPVLRRELAMKVIRDDLAGDEAREALRRFVVEARVTAQLDHPGVVPIHRLGIDAEGRVFFTMKLVAGETLADALRSLREGRPGWTQTRAVQALLRVAETLAFAHSKGIVHRDLKPANVMLGRFGEVFVMDWGLAKPLAEPESTAGPAPEPARTRRLQLEDLGAGGPASSAGQVLGTPAYMPPEQAGGDPSALDARADVYALGAILYELLAGRAPYCDQVDSRDGAALVRALRSGDPTPLERLAPDAPEELAAISAKAMARDPSGRYASAAELAEDLQRWLEGRPVLAAGAGPWRELSKWIRRNRALATSLALLVLAVVGGSIAFGVSRQRANREIGEQRDLLRAQALRSEGLRLAAIAAEVGREDAGAGLHVALEGARLAPGAAAREALYQALERFWPGRELRGHDSYVLELSFTPDGRHLVSRESDRGSLIVWRVADGAIAARIPCAGGSSSDVALRPDGAVLASADADGRIRLFEIPSGRPAAELRGHAGGVRALDWSPDGARLASAGEDGSVRVWDPDAATGLAPVCVHEGGARGVAFDPGAASGARGNRLLSYGADGLARVHALEDAGAREVLRLELAGSTHAEWSPRGTWICLGNPPHPYDRLVDGASGAPVAGPLGEPLQLVALAPDESAALLARYDPSSGYSLWRWRASDGDLARSSERLERQDSVWRDPVAVFHLGSQLGAALSGKDIALLDLASGREQARLTGHRYMAFALALSRDGRWLASAGGDRCVRTWDLARWPRLLPVEAQRDAPTWPLLDGSLAFRWIEEERAGAPVSRYEVIDLAAGAVRPLDAPADAHGPIVHPQSARILLRDPRGLSIVDARTGATALRLDRPLALESLRTRGSASNSGRRFACWSEPGRALVVDAESGGLRELPIPIQHGAIWGVDDEGRWLVVSHGVNYANCALIEVDSQRLTELRGHGGTIASAAFHPTRASVATTAVDGSFALWSLPDGGLIERVLGLPVTQERADWSPDGRLLRVGNYVYDAERREAWARIPLNSACELAHFTPDGRWLVRWWRHSYADLVPVDPEAYARGLVRPPANPRVLDRLEIGDAAERRARERAYRLQSESALDHVAAGTQALADGDAELALSSFRGAALRAPRRAALRLLVAAALLRRSQVPERTEADRAADRAAAAAEIEAARGADLDENDIDRWRAELAPLGEDAQLGPLLEAARAR